MQDFRISFRYTRTVTTQLRAESEEAVHAFLDSQGDDWSVIDNCPEIVTDDISEPDYDFTTFGDYRIEPADRFAPTVYEIDGVDLVEVER